MRPKPTGAVPADQPKRASPLAATARDTGPSRRQVIGGLVPLAAAGLLPTSVFVAPTVRAARDDVGIAMPSMLEAARAFLASLDEPGRTAALVPFTSQRRARWNYMLGSAFAPGLPLERMTAEQKNLAMTLLASGLSPAGLVTAERIMLQQDILRDELRKGSADRNRERFSVTVFGEPNESGPWSWRFEGHHLTLTFTLIGDRVVSTSPSAFASEPNTVSSGPHTGLVVLTVEERVGRQLFRDLAPAARRKALVSERSFGNVITLAGRETTLDGARAGIPLSDLTSAQVDLALELVHAQAVDNFAEPLAAEQRSRISRSDLMGATFAWAGANLDGSIYYRLHGDTFLVEFATLANQPQHHHTVRHDVGRHLGLHAI
ncbi:MAG: DUF3500 domain-containing protein [Hyphomicrobiaceae bacterium]